MDGINTENIRQMMRVANILKGYVQETKDPHYTELFLKAADELTHRANTIAQAASDVAQRPLDIQC